jgi:hypothetical protein
VTTSIERKKWHHHRSMERLSAAFLAISNRFSAVMLSARAFPPFLPNATAAGSLPCSSGVGSRSGFCPVAISIIDLASWLGSLGRLGWFVIGSTLCFAVQSGSFGVRGFFGVRYFHNGLFAIFANPHDMPVLDSSRDVAFPFHPVNMLPRRSVFHLGNLPQSN